MTIVLVGSSPSLVVSSQPTFWNKTTALILKDRNERKWVKRGEFVLLSKTDDGMELALIHPVKEGGVPLYDPVYVSHFFFFAVIGGVAGWIANRLDKGSGLGRVWDVLAGILGSFLGVSFAYMYQVEVNGFGAVLGVAFLGSVVFLTLLWLFSRRWRRRREPETLDGEIKALHK